MEASTSDVLILLDTDGLGTCTSSGGNGLTELIAASDAQAQAAAGFYSFTHSLIRSLEILSMGPSFAVSYLYKDIFARMEAQAISESGAKNRIQAPIHLVLSQKKKFPRSIVIPTKFQRAPYPVRQKLIEDTHPTSSKERSEPPTLEFRADRAFTENIYSLNSEEDIYASDVERDQACGVRSIEGAGNL
jgi:hypothetical protein